MSRSSSASDHRHYTRWRPSQPTLELGLADDIPFEHDPLHPHPEEPTPIDLVVRLTRSQREARVHQLVDLAQRRYAEALSTHADGKTIAGVCALVSGGNDSYTVARLFRDQLTHLVHANTGTGIEATRTHVRSTAISWGLPLIEHTPAAGEGYFDLVLGKVTARSQTTGEVVQSWPGGFPGPAAHALMQQRLKGRCLEHVPRALGISRSRTERVVFIAGRRRSESRRRAAVPHHERKGTVIWSSPIAVWHKADLKMYRLMSGDVPSNPVAEVLGMSGECGCLANAVAGETGRWRTAYPDEPFIRRVEEVERILAGPGFDHIPPHRKRWGWGSEHQETDAEVPMSSDSLCGPNCGPDLLDLMDPLFPLD